MLICREAKAIPYAVKGCLQLGISLSHPLLWLLVLNEENPAGLDLHFCSDSSCFRKCVFSCPYAARCWWPKICCPTWDLWQTYSAHTSDCLWREASMKKADFILPTAGLTIRSPQTVFFLRCAWLEINLGECFVVHWLVWEWGCLAKVLVSGIGTGSIFEECDCFLMMFLVLNLSF